MAEAAQDNRGNRRRRLARIAYLLLLAAGILLAWQIHEFLISQAGPGPALKDPNFGMATTTKRAQGALAPLAEDPGGIFPPPGARRIWAFQRHALGLLEQHGRYEYGGSASSAGEHYKRTLTERGFVFLGPSRGPGGGRRALVFVKGSTRAVVSLPRPSENGRIMVVGLTVLSSAEEP